MPTLTYAQALNEALREEMRRDPRVFLMGEDIGLHGGIFRVTKDLVDEFGHERVRDTPISESAFVGVGIGAAIGGMRPVVELLFMDFALVAADQIVNQAAKLRYMTAGQCKVPLVIRTAMGAGRRAAAQHSQSLQVWYAHIPGLKVVMPSTPEDAKGLLKSAIRDDNPVIFLEDKMMYTQKGPIPDGDYTIPLGVGRVHRTGEDVTIVCTSSMLYPSLEAAERLAQQGIQAEVIDPRTISPLDDELLIRSAIKTGKVVVVDEGYQSFGVTAEIAARIMQGAFDYLDEPVRRIGAADVPLPFAPSLEDLTIPSTDWIYDTVKEMLAKVVA